ncbi:short-chain dehydrogenase [Zhouia spongiae]|uniref:Short-chain dehydrogenase n=1 Tax=Zhouia spongiae TaxID=2202721 RepID=A0ABY3YHR3_9FLAO|nr:VTT domain-containing protein [Zhouia spongiae]UNY97268.1 short-chain dehydrogenase [Zhouia spongiae]
MERTNVKRKKSKAKLLHQYYQYTGFYDFVWKSVKKATLPIVLVIAAIFAVDYFLFDLNAFFKEMTETLPPMGVFTIFFISESLLGLIPPEIFIAWAGKSVKPIFFLAILALLSYIGGLISYFIGVAITKIPSVHRYMEVKMQKHLKNTAKWGGFLIIVGALLPIPFSITCVAAGIINFPFRYVTLYGTLRFLRFALYALVIFNVV